MKLPIEHEYSSCVAYTRDLELYTAWVDEQLSLYKNLADEYGLVVFADLAELQNQRDVLLGALQCIADGQVMNGSFTHADTVLRYQAIAHAAIASVKEPK